MQKPRLFSFYFILIGLGVFAWVGSIWALATSANFQIQNDVFSSGGLETGSSDNYQLQDTLAEFLINSATSTSANFGLKTGFRELYADQYVTFSIIDTDISLGTLDSASVSSAAGTMTVETNASNGFSLSVSGTTLTSGSDTITAIGATAVASSAGSEQFGFNFVANTTPALGADPSGTSPIGSAANGYNTADVFAFDDTGSQVVATSSAPVNVTTFTASYIANITSTTEQGDYSTSLTYTATGNF